MGFGGEFQGIDPESLGEMYEERNLSKGGGGGGKKKEKRQSDATKAASAAEMRDNQLQRKLDQSEHGEKTPAKDIEDVIADVMEMDNGDVDMKHLFKYIGWLKANINSIDDLVIPKEEIVNMEMMTATLGAGGGGKDTSNNARAATHLYTGMRIKSQDDRRAQGNVEDLKEKFTARLKHHLGNWKIVMGIGQTEKERKEKAPFDLDKVEDEVLERATGKK